MEDGENSARLNATLSKYFKTRMEYDRVTVLVIYWQDSSNSGFREEGEQIGALFRDEFNYNVEFFEIPSQRSQLALDVRLGELMVANQQANTLLILHYGGHGDSDDDSGHKRQSVWAMESHDSAPMLCWSELQPKFRQHSSEVLIFLDCCFASQAARGSRSPIPENVELLVACALNIKTVLPGPQSFTSQLIREIKDGLRADDFIKISAVHKNLAAKESELIQSAVYYPLGRSRASITLRPLVVSAGRISSTPPDAGFLTLRLSLTDVDSTALDEALNEIVQWLKINPPRTISNVRIEQLRCSATAVRNYITENNSRGRTVAAFSELSAPAREDVVSAWTTFSQGVTKMASYLRFGLDTSSETDIYLEKALSTTYAKELNHSFEPVQKAIERNILALPILSEKTELLSATEDPQLIALGLGEMLKLRVLAHFAPENTILPINISIPQSSGLFPSRWIDRLPDVPQLERVLIEAKQFEEQVDPRMMKTSKSRLESLSILLHPSKSADFHALSCDGYFFEPPRAYGLIFRIPQYARESSLSLHDILSKKIKVPSKPTLEQRLQIAHKIGTAVLKWHLVDWVHQGIASYNIVFFYDSLDGVDYAHPYLCGFEYARKHSAPSTSRIVEQLEVNVYRHPDRQGVPNASHRKEHDLYSYGILLLELGLWDLAQNVLRLRKGEISPSDMAERLRASARKELAHYAGTAYQRAASKCLENGLGVLQDDKMNSGMAKAFETQVLMEIAQGISLS